jgi:glutamine cyclotransferase
MTNPAQTDQRGQHAAPPAPTTLQRPRASFRLKKSPRTPVTPLRMALAACLATLATPALATIPVYGYVIKKSYPHDPAAFTQGLFFRDGFLFESTGLNGQSSIRKVQLESGKVLKKKDIPSDFFGEGITGFGNEIVSLTWTSHVGFVLDLDSFDIKQKYAYEGEGWGLTNDEQFLYMSDGTPTIRILNPKTRQEIRRIQVNAEGKPLPRLNELEMVNGELFANVWGSDIIARIDPKTGNVVGWIDLSGLLNDQQRAGKNVDVLNGIAWDGKKRRLFVTGKLWPRLFEIELVERKKP